jgi:hypothetical protein
VRFPTKKNNSLFAQPFRPGRSGLSQEWFRGGKLSSSRNCEERLTQKNQTRTLKKLPASRSIFSHPRFLFEGCASKGTIVTIDKQYVPHHFLREAELPPPPGFRYTRVLPRAGRSRMRAARAIRMFSIWQPACSSNPLGRNKTERAIPTQKFYDGNRKLKQRSKRWRQCSHFTNRRQHGSEISMIGPVATRWAINGTSFQAKLPHAPNCLERILLHKVIEWFSGEHVLCWWYQAISV